MDRKICTLSMIPLRKEPNHRSEMVSQMLPGETAEELDTLNDWLLVRMDFDKYEGWVEKNALADTEVSGYEKKEIIQQPLVPAELNGQLVFLPAGSELKESSESDEFLVAGKKYKISTSAKIYRNNDSLLHTAALFLNAPYLWGGRTALGIDCSGFMQVVFKTKGISLARDASEQALQGAPVNSIDEAKPEDLMFFANTENQISHVGMYLGEGKIIHASKHVRIDKVDENGIFNSALNEYSHQSLSIRRIKKNSGT